MIPATLGAVALFSAFAAGVLACWLVLHRHVDRLAGLIERQQAALTAIPANAVEHRAVVAEDYRQEFDLAYAEWRAAA